MVEIKSIGTEYQIIIKGPWEQVAKAGRITKAIIKNTQSRTCFFNSKEIEAIKNVLTKYLTPKEEENFTDYRDRVFEKYSGIKEKLKELLIDNKGPFHFNLIEFKGESTLLVESIIREKEYQATISTSGDYSKRGASIATGLKEALEQNSIPFSYKTLDKLI